MEYLGVRDDAGEEEEEKRERRESEDVQGRSVRRGVCGTVALIAAKNASASAW